MSADPRNRGQRVVDLRELHALTQSELASLAGIPQPNLSKIERGLTELTATTVHRLCQATATPAEFFEVEPATFSSEDINFRKAAKVSAKGGRMVVQAFRGISFVADQLADAPVALKRTDLPVAQPSDIVSRRDIDEWAQKVRSRSGLVDDEPVRNVTRLIERAGIAVAPMHALTTDKAHILNGHAGMSKSGGRRTVAIVQGQSGDRQRFTLAHELGHVLLHAARNVPAKEREAEAHFFAGALLLPRPVAEVEISESLTLQGFMRLKARFGVSMQASIMRGRHLGLISVERQRSLMIQISSRGWRLAEPVDVALESPMLLWTELVAVYGSAPYVRASADMGHSAQMLAEWIPDRTPTRENNGGTVMSLRGPRGAG